MAAPVRIKICGITTPADAELAARLGADAIGLNFYERSPRYISLETQAKPILEALPPYVDPVALFVKPSDLCYHSLLHTYGFRTLQLHGSATISPLWSGQLVRAFPVKDAASLREIDTALETPPSSIYPPSAGGPRVTAILVDAHVPGLHGGTGQTAPWHLLADYRPPVPLILAGGLTPDNVAEAIRTVRPYAVDVASGVESRPGVKDPEKLRRFIDAARSA